MISELSFLITGMVLGIASSISPGPLLTLVISETLKYKAKEGIKVAIAPLITDGPIILFILLILNKLADFNFIIGTISVFGSLYLTYLAYQNFFIKKARPEIKDVKSNSIRKGVITNFLNPYPYIFWISVGGPIFIKALEVNLLSSILFVITLYISAIGTLIIAAFIVQNARNFLRTKVYIYIVKFLGFILLIFAYIFMKEGLNKIGII